MLKTGQFFLKSTWLTTSFAAKVVWSSCSFSLVSDVSICASGAEKKNKPDYIWVVPFRIMRARVPARLKLNFMTGSTLDVLSVQSVLLQ